MPFSLLVFWEHRDRRYILQLQDIMLSNWWKAVLCMLAWFMMLLMTPGPVDVSLKILPGAEVMLAPAANGQASTRMVQPADLLPALVVERSLRTFHADARNAWLGCFGLWFGSHIPDK